MPRDVENLEHHYRPRHRELRNEDMDPSFSERSVFEELELLARTPELRRAWDRVRTAAIRGAAAGVLIKGGLHALTFVMYLLSRVRGKGRKRVTTLADVLHDTVLHTCFLAALGSSYTAVDEGIAVVFGKARTQRWRALVAGLVAGQSLRITGSNQRHYSLATYILLRGLTLLVRTGNKSSAPPALRALLQPTRMQNGDTLLMCVAASQILYSFIMAPSTLPPTYVRFITRMGGKDPSVWAAIREQALRNSLGLSPGPLRALQGTPLGYLNSRPGRLRRTPCEFFHPGQSCAGHAAATLPQAYGAALSVYVPFYLVSSVLVHRTGLLAQPRHLLPKMAVAVLRSSLFLSAYIATAFAGACTGFGVSGTNTGAVIAGSVWAGGLATLLEKKSRRMELAMYCAARALEAFIRCCWLWSSDVTVSTARPGTAGMMPPSAAVLALQRRGAAARGGDAAAAAASSGGRGGLRLDVLMFSLGCGAIMHCYSDSCGEHRDVFRSKYLNVLDFIFGNEGVQQGSISHVPTNLELVSTVGRRLRTMSLSVLSSGDYTGTTSPLPRSGAPSQGDGLSLSSPATAAAAAAAGESNYTAAGHNHHGGHGYTRYLQLQQQRHQQRHQQLLQCVDAGGKACNGGAGSSSGSGLVDRSGGSLEGRLRGSQSLGAARGLRGEGGAAGSRWPAPPASAPGTSYSRGGSNSTISMTPMPGQSLETGTEVAEDEAAGVVREAAARLAGEQQGRLEQQAARAASAPPAAAAPVIITAASGTASTAASDAGAAKASAPGRSAGGSSSHSSSEWEDVWSATTGAAPAPSAAYGAVATASSPAQREAPSRAALPPKSTGPATAAAMIFPGGMPRISSEPLVTGRSVRRSPFAPPATQTTAQSAQGALGWAARLVSGAFHLAGGSGSAAAAASDAGAAGSGPGLAQSRSEFAVAGATGSEAGDRRKHGGSGGWGLPHRTNSMRRISTAPHGLQHSAKALLLLSDPATEHCGHGRSSYKELQRLSGGGGSMASAAVLAAAGASSAGAAAAEDGVNVPSPASSSSTAAEAAVELFSSSPPRGPALWHGDGPASPTGRGVSAPSRARPVPVPNAASRTPAFRPRGPICSSALTAAVAAAGIGSGSGGAAATSSQPDLGLRAMGPSLAGRYPGVGSSSLGSSMNRLSDGFGPRPAHSGGGNAPHTSFTFTSANYDASRSGSNRAGSGRSSGGGSADATAGGSPVTFELHGALSHPSPVPRAPVWPRLSVDIAQQGPSVCRSAPEARVGALAAVLAAEERDGSGDATADERTAARIFELELEVEVEAEVEGQEGGK